MNNKKWYIRIWDEGKYVDVWSFNHFLCGFVFAKGITFIQLTFLKSILLIFVLVVVWEIFEMQKNVKETVFNRIIDITIGLIGFLCFFYLDNLKAIPNLIFISVFLIPLLILGVWGYIAYRLENGKK